MIIAFTLLVCLVGLLVFVLSKDNKIMEIGKIMFWTGLLAFLLVGAEPLIKIVGGR